MAESKKDKQYEKLFKGKEHNSSAWRKAALQNTMHSIGKKESMAKKMANSQAASHARMREAKNNEHHI